MHLRGQEIQSQLNAAMADVSKYTIENTRLLAQTTSLATAVETLKVKIHQLQVEHRDLDDVISQLAHGHALDQLQMQRLKKRKLFLKDQITLLDLAVVMELCPFLRRRRTLVLPPLLHRLEHRTRKE